MFSVIFVLCVVILDLFLFLYLPSGYHRSKLIRKKLHVISQATRHSSTGKLNFTSHGKTFIMEIKDEIIPENLCYNIKYECKRILINNEVISKIHLLDISEVSKHTILTFSPFRPKAEVEILINDAYSAACRFEKKYKKQQRKQLKKDSKSRSFFN